MEEIISNIYNMWGEFWGSSSPFERALAICNTIGATYTFIISFILLQKIEDLQENHNLLEINYVLARTSLVAILLGCFFTAIKIKVPEFYEFTMYFGMTALLTNILITVNRNKKASNLPSN